MCSLGEGGGGQQYTEFNNAIVIQWGRGCRRTVRHDADGNVPITRHDGRSPFALRSSVKRCKSVGLSHGHGAPARSRSVLRKT